MTIQWVNEKGNILAEWVVSPSAQFKFVLDTVYGAKEYTLNFNYRKNPVTKETETDKPTGCQLK
jgi:hypothetical protein